jgi:hypothetical protein
MKFSLVTAALLAYTVRAADDYEITTGECTETDTTCAEGNECILRTITSTYVNSKKNKNYSTLMGKDENVDLDDVWAACYTDADSETLLAMSGINQSTYTMTATYELLAQPVAEAPVEEVSTGAMAVNSALALAGSVAVALTLY